MEDMLRVFNDRMEMLDRRIQELRQEIKDKNATYSGGGTDSKDKEPLE